MIEQLSNKAARLRTQLRRFREREDGAITIEAMLILPMLLWSMLASYTFYDGYRQGSRNIKAAYAVADVLSRERNMIDSAYMNTMLELMDRMVSTRAPVSLRIAYLNYNAEDDVHNVFWTCVRGDRFPNWDDGTIAQIKDALPAMPDNGKMIVVETHNVYQPPFDIGFDINAFDMGNFVFTHPRVFDNIELTNPDPAGCISYV